MMNHLFYPVESFQRLVEHDGYIHMSGRWSFDGAGGTYYLLDATDGQLIERRFFGRKQVYSTSFRDLAVGPGGRVYLSGSYSDDDVGVIGYATTFERHGSVDGEAFGANQVTAVASGANHYSLAVSRASGPDYNWLQIHGAGTETTNFGVTGTELARWSVPGLSWDIAVTSRGVTYSTGNGHLLAWTSSTSAGIVGTEVTSSLVLGDTGSSKTGRTALQAALSGSVVAMDLDLAPDGSVYVAGAFYADDRDQPDPFVAKYSAAGEEVWSWVIRLTASQSALLNEAGEFPIQVDTHPVTGQPFLAWSTSEPEGALKVLRLEEAEGTIVQTFGCTSPDTWSYILRGFDVDDAGRAHVSGLKRIRTDLPGGGRGFVLAIATD